MLVFLLRQKNEIRIPRTRRKKKAMNSTYLIDCHMKAGVL